MDSSSICSTKNFIHKEEKLEKGTKQELRLIKKAKGVQSILASWLLTFKNSIYLQKKKRKENKKWNW